MGGGREGASREEQEGRRQEKVRREKHLWLERKETAARPAEVLTIFPITSSPASSGKRWRRTPPSHASSSSPPQHGVFEAALPGSLAKPGARDYPKGQEVRLSKRVNRGLRPENVTQYSRKSIVS